ncbi:hypothetical protein [Desulforhopalus sp. 52FAK]
MRVDKELVEQLVVQILGQLSSGHDVENVLVLGSRSEADQLRLPGSADSKVNVLCVDDVYNAGEIDRYILPRLEVEDMADLAVGKATSSKAKDVLALLLGGKTVEVYQYGYTKFEETAPVQLYQLYSDYAKTLSDFGLCPLQKQVRRVVRVTSKVLSEKDIEKCAAEGVTRIGVSGKALVTSLAEECAKKFGIEIERN